MKKKDGSTDIVKILSNQMGIIKMISEETGNSFTIPIYEIDTIVKIDDGDRRYSKLDGTSMIGYKGVELYKGVLRDGKWIYELGIPYVEKYRDPFSTEYQDVYSHYSKQLRMFCGGGEIISTLHFATLMENNIRKCGYLKLEQRAIIFRIQNWAGFQIS